ncbi:MAG TPA: PEP-CTERM-box response regulator transcription factor [Stellaceae bacterium]|nr:PEP-CTERM-box response regulator transcription factor [Stellaceae bacterium]
MNKPKLLVVEDDDGLIRQYRWAFPEYQVSMAQTREAACAIVGREHPPVAVIDLGLPPDPDGASEGLALIRDILALMPDAKVIVATGSAEVGHALEAIAGGAFDFYQKPVDIAVLRVMIERAHRLYRLEAENRRLRALPRPSPIERIVTGDEAMLKVCRSIEKLAATDVTVLILGDSGTGKEALANALHELGPRAGQPFVPINCAAIPDTLLESELFGHERGAFTGAIKRTIGKVESAHGGTLFLDEIGDLPHPLQVKLLRFLQDQMIERVGGRQPIQVDVRIVCATNQDLSEKMQRGEFREDLFYRLNEVIIRVPPLRQRGGDAVLLANHFLNRFAPQFGRPIKGFSAAALAAVTAHPWPGNVRELENRVKRAVVMSEGRVIEPADLELAAPLEESIDLDIRAARSRAEREVIELALAQCNGIISTAAKLLKISRPTLYALMEAHGIAINSEPRGQEAARVVSLPGTRIAEGD